MLPYVHQLVVNFACLHFGGGQVVYMWSTAEFSHWKQMPAASGNDADQSRVMGQKTKKRPI